MKKDVFKYKTNHHRYTSLNDSEFRSHINERFLGHRSKYRRANSERFNSIIKNKESGLFVLDEGVVNVVEGVVVSYSPFDATGDYSSEPINADGKWNPEDNPGNENCKRHILYHRHGYTKIYIPVDNLSNYHWKHGVVTEDTPEDSLVFNDENLRDDVIYDV